MSTEYTIEGYREKFKKSPVGVWHTASGTFSVVMDVVWEFYPDGTGMYVTTGPFGAESQEPVPFEWKECAERTIWFGEINGPGQPLDWCKFTYDFIEVSTDVGTEIAMTEVYGDGVFTKGFGDSIPTIENPVPLAYIGPGDKDNTL